MQTQRWLGARRALSLFLGICILGGMVSVGSPAQASSSSGSTTVTEEAASGTIICNARVLRLRLRALYNGSSLTRWVEADGHVQCVGAGWISDTGYMTLTRDGVVVDRAQVMIRPQTPEQLMTVSIPCPVTSSGAIPNQSRRHRFSTWARLGTLVRDPRIIQISETFGVPKTINESC